jgi:flagella basal body P-ring formation protein FlgA
VTLTGPSARGGDSRLASRVSTALLALAALLAPRTAHAQQGYVASRSLPRGHTLVAEDMTAGAAAVARTRDASRETRVAPVGWVTKRVLAAGEPLRAPAVAPPEAVRAGQPVDVLWTDGAIQLRLKGTAMHAAALGARVTVRIDARRRLEGVAVSPTAVRLR